MPFVIIDGLGTYTVGDHTFKPGSTRCDDVPVLRAVVESGLDWIHVQADRATETFELPPEEADETPNEPYVTFLGRDGKYYYVDGTTGRQSDPYDEEQIALAKAEMAEEEAGKIALSGDVDDPNAPLSGTLTKNELKQTTFVCQEPGCGRTFNDSGSCENHERIYKHGVHKPNASQN